MLASHRQPEDAYGVPNPALQQLVTRDRFQDVDDLQVGMQFQANTEQGPISVRVAKIEGEQVTVDGNHPLAGQQLHFDVEVVDIRVATEEEISHGHVHQAGGCCGGGSCGEILPLMAKLLVAQASLIATIGSG